MATVAALPRKRDADATRQRILEAAFDRFAAVGYAQAGVREIAAQAGVAASLVLRYFGSKLGLFERALVHAVYARGAFTEDRAAFGRRMAEIIAHENDTRLTTMTVLALGDPEAEAAVRRVVAEHMVGGLRRWFGDGDTQGRAEALYALMTGFTVQVRLSEGRQLPPGTVAWLADAMQRLVDG